MSEGIQQGDPGGAPDQQFADFGHGGPEPGAAEQRTSVLAIVSLVLGVLCVPGFGVLGVVLGVAALFLIARSEGRLMVRLMGGGFAGVGIVLGLIASTFWLAVLFGVNQVASLSADAAEQTMKAVEQRDEQKLREAFVPDAESRLTTARIERFGSAVEDELGAYKSGPGSLWALRGGFEDLRGVQERMQASALPRSGGGVMDLPLPTTFEQGRALVYLRLNVERMSDFDHAGAMVNVGVGTPGGFEAWLLEPSYRPTEAAEGSDAPGAGGAGAGAADAEDAGSEPPADGGADGSGG